MLDNPAEFLLRSRKKSRDVLERDQWDIEGIAEANEPRRFHRCADIEHAGKKRRLVCDDSDGVSVEPGETDDDIFGKVFVDFEESGIVCNGVYYVLDVVGLLRIFGNER